MEKTPKNDAGKKASEVVAICDHPNFNVESLIRTIRGQKVMLDFDLSMLYGVQNKRLNEQVKRNKERFPDDFMFQLTQCFNLPKKSGVFCGRKLRPQNNLIMRRIAT